MKKMIRYAFIAIAAVVSLSSCTKDDNKTKTELLTTGNWKIVSDQERVGTGQWEENISNHDACDLDDYMAFKADHTVDLNDGATKCDPQDDQSRIVAWMFMDGETKLTIDSQEFTIDELSANTLMITLSDSYGGVTYYTKLTLKH